MTRVTLLFYFGLSALFMVEATINVCIPLPPADNTSAASTREILKGVTSDIVKKLTVDDSEQGEYVGHVDVDIDHPAIRFLGTLDDVRIYNLTNFDICFLDNFVLDSLVQFHVDIFNITFKNIRLDGLYNLTGNLGDIFDIYGDGNFWLELRNFSLSMVNFTFTLGDEICFPINLEINLQEMGNWLDNFMYDDELEELFNGVITSILPESLKIVWQEWKEIFDKPLEDAINDILHNNDVATVFHRLRNAKNGENRDWLFCYDTAEM